MQGKDIHLVVLCSALLLSSLSSAAQTATTATGHWEGMIHMSNPETGQTRDVGIAVDLAQTSESAWIGSMSVSKSTAVDVPLSGISVKDTNLRFTARLPQNASFEGRISVTDANKISGIASNAAGQAPFELTRNGAANVRVPPPSSRLSKDFEGSWEGTLEVGAKVRRVVLKLVPAADGTAMATLISVDDGNMEIPVTTVTLKDGALQLEARSVSGKYQGKLGATGEITGEWTQGSEHLRLTFKHISPGELPPAERK